jgi:hypothetical protein
MLMEWAPISVVERTSLATEKERWNNWLRVVPSAPAPDASPDRVFHLPQNLRLAQDHRVQATGNPKGMPSYIVVMQVVEMPIEGIGADITLARQPLQSLRKLPLRARAINLSPVASRQNSGFVLPIQGLAKRCQRPAHLIDGKCKPAP